MTKLKFHVTKPQELVFNALKQKLCKAPVLGIPNIQKQFEIEVDALLLCKMEDNSKTFICKLTVKISFFTSSSETLENTFLW